MSMDDSVSEEHKRFEIKVNDQERLEQALRAMGMTPSGYLQQIIEAHIQMADDMDAGGEDESDSIAIYIEQDLWDSYVGVYKDPERGPDYDDPQEVLEGTLQRIEQFLTDS